ncbi:MAG TPA: tetratricopeptide repeat protein, partial [Nitrosopumilaceae archaeon]|nr:tetratricopeptide repeat protein [Nitrosopumilaceae archaeon]
MIKKLFIIGSILFSISDSVGSNLSVTNSLPYDLGPKDKVKIELAKQKLYGGQYKSALNIFKEVLNTNPTDGITLYYTAECHYKLGEFDKAL